MKMQIVTAVVAAAFLSACTTDPYTGQSKVSNLAGGAALGAVAGAGLGMLAGGNDRRNALIGAGVGALAGGAIGGYMDQQENELRAQLQGTGVSVTRVGNNIVLNMPSNITFDSDQSALKPQFYNTLNSVALVLKKFERSLVDVAGHTDSTGSDSYNQQLSQQRAQSVASYLISQGNNPQRFYVQGYGESRPVADNSSEAGRAANRRVEIQIAPLS
ncbi:outer membrane protein OmpA-like peptidoglycan-associated protein [Hoeflea marina]|uniref:Outer membrane protein OmpA-like peptidoglycan-associated protein n=1 Tax=Hoeflea marina TaxID=274592 RepID=A0A317PU03_9HYPH|nr:OmpA family protein [Hoeflea marina]PWW04417.1 outer membrane protein OmpA-like peptidoglycan-associated protein [Hoeflea marina]